jgi:hypothetical protein
LRVTVKKWGNAFGYSSNFSNLGIRRWLLLGSIHYLYRISKVLICCDAVANVAKLCAEHAEVTMIHSTMRTKVIIVFSYLVCLIGLAFAAWISLINLEEVINRMNGQYTFYSQRATLTDDQAAVYFTCWTLLFIFTGYLAIRRLVKKKYREAIICVVFLLLFILLSTCVDKLFYNELVRREFNAQPLQS